ncbi:hypothetical protein [Marinobacter nauticus]|uniref:hypothetical protein n=1 Tax=Marinobacter nauticus TaxID=2743 RepID=UPI001C590F2D|nr:hypothetical protein [Marinobacter nauticus]MBW3198731.1 hypothetical protein [Marinobacter nauticus]MBY6184141.1 hypothetical protein [Marinobacter nauticus]
MQGPRWSSADGLANSRRMRMLTALVVLFVLWWVLLGRLDRELQRVEEQSVAMVLTQLRSALVIKGAEAMLSRDQALASLEGRNPFNWVDHQWPRYKGGCGGNEPDSGSWCFANQQQNETGESARGWLIYKPKQPITIEGKRVKPEQPIAWRVISEFADRNRNNLREQDERLTGLSLRPVPFQHTTVNRQDARR